MTNKNLALVRINLILILTFVAGFIAQISGKLRYISRTITTPPPPPQQLKFSDFAIVFVLLLSVIVPQSANAQTVPIVPSWDSNNMAETTIVSQGSGTYTRIFGTIDTVLGSRVYNFTATQVRGTNAPTQATKSESNTIRVRGFGENNNDVETVLELPFGTFHVGIPSAAECTSAITGFCYRVAFDANALNLSTLERETITLKLQVVMVYQTGEFAGQSVNSFLTVYLQSPPRITMSLNSGVSNSVISYKDLTEYRNRPGTINLYNPSNQTILVNRIDRDTADNAVTKNMKDRTDSTVGYEANVFDSDYGKWHVATDNSKFEFRPDANVINGKSVGDTFSSELIIGLSDGATPPAIGTIKASIKINFEIRGTPTISLAYVSGTQYSETSGGVTTAFDGSQFADLVGSISTTNLPNPFYTRYVASATRDKPCWNFKRWRFFFRGQC